MTIKVERNMHDALKVIKNVGAWMRDTRKDNFSKWWDPDAVSEELLAPYIRPDEFYVVYIDGTPAATIVLQEEQTFEDWTVVDGENTPPRSTYIFFVAVAREYAGQSLVNVLMNEAEKRAREQGSKFLRLDTNSREPFLCNLYESLGYIKIHNVTKGNNLIAYYQKQVD